MINGTERGLCCEPRCKNLRRKDRLRCFKHDTRRNRAKHPMRYAFQTVKDHARARGIYFGLTFTTFEAFALQSDYLNRKGNGTKCLTVDRIDNLKGYVKGNIRPLTRERNRDKQARIDAIRIKHGTKWKEKYEDNDQN